MKQVKLNIGGEIVTFNRVEGGRRKPDPAEKETEKALKALDSKLRNVYQTAADDLFMKQQSWIDAHLKRVEKYQKQVEAGLISQQDYDAWMQGQLFQEKAWALKRGQLARTMAEADQRALEMINEGKLEVFAENANYMLFGVEQNTGATAAFGLYDQNAVLRLVKDEPNLLPMPEIDEEKDYAWYNRIIGNAVTQGIIQGESLDKICLRVAEESGERGLNALRRNARTAYTGAQNAGRVEGMKRARDELGIHVKKRWMSTLDDKTRDSHQELDGKTAEIDEPFDSLLGPIMYPGDPDAEPGNVYNCRCTLTYVYPKYNTAAVKRNDGEDGSDAGAVTYREWKEQKAREGQEPEPQQAKPPEIKDTNIYGRHIEIDDRLKGETRETLNTLIDQYDTRLEKVELGQSSGVLAAGSVDMSGAGMKISSREPTVAIHEFAHTLANSKADKYGLTNDEDFWKEIKKIKREYKKDVDKEYNFRRFISSYEHSATGAEAVDEFFAEAFAQAKAREMGIKLPEKYGEDFTYSQRVLDTVDKYFRRGRHDRR